MKPAKLKNKHPSTSILFAMASLFLLHGCTGVPEGIKPVENFELERYLGKWYEIARLDHSFEEGLSNVSARYEPRKDGGVRVVNTGYSSEEQAWDTAEGKAYFVDQETSGHLKVSFFGPFYGSYVVFELDQDDYQYSFVSGPSREYLWLLARTPSVSEELKARFVEVAEENGFDTAELIFVSHALQE